MIGDKYLDSPSLTINPNVGILTFSNSYPLDDGFRSASLSFSNNYSLDDGFDGGVLEVSVDGGPFQDILAAGGHFFAGGYNGTISTCCGNPLAGREAWTGNSGGFILTAVDLIGFSGHSIVLRWRMASDSGGSGDGWRIDDIAIGCERSTPTPTPFPTPTPTPRPTPSCSPPCLVAVVFSENFDELTPPTLPSDWIATNALGPPPLWVTSNGGVLLPPYDSPPNAAFIDDPGVVSDKRLDSVSIFFPMWDPGTPLTFRHSYNLEASNKDPNLGFDGGVLEISTDGGNTFQDILDVGGIFVEGGYNRIISTDRGSPIGGRQAWSGNSGGFITTAVSLPFTVTSVTLRWRMASDTSGSSEGWRVDTIYAAWCLPFPCETPTPTPSGTPTPTPTATATVTVSPTITPTPKPTLTPRPIPTPRLHPTPHPRP